MVIGDDERGTVLFDVDGTLVDSNYQHTVAWYRAFRQCAIVLPLWRIHRHIGMGGDQIVPSLVGDECDRAIGDELRAAQKAHFEGLLDEIAPLEGAHDLLAALQGSGQPIVLASSSPQEYLDRYLDLLDAHQLVEAVTTSSDVEATKPAPDLIEAARAKSPTQAAVLIGDSPWDIQAAARSDLPCVALLTGGYSQRELIDAGAEAVFPSLLDLHAHIVKMPLERSPTGS